ncbi:MAG: serine/threonine-protein kinase [Pseudomonadota bacterium]
MTPERWEQLEPILDAVLTIDEEQQEAWLEANCPDVAVRTDVIAMLQAGQASGFLEGQALDFAAPDLAPQALSDADALAGAGRSIGAWRVLRELGHGGMSVVYLVQRADGQFDQRAALKLLRHPGGDRQDREARFLAERQILAALDHPHIARVIDGGLSSAGWPYLVLEYVDGSPISDYCRSKRLGLDARLALFAQVCEAVQHAHQRLVVHRDVKPSNVLVFVDDEGQAQIKLLDFGIAKLLDEPAEGALTLTGVRPMTPQYAAPEQLLGEPITTATDVYGLGVLLFELLTDRAPYRFAVHRPSEIERAICVDPPPLPSAVAAEQGDATVLKIPQDLDTIVLKAMGKSPQERYRSVFELAEDVQRYRQGMTVLARRAGPAYRLRKFAGRHPFGVSSGVVVGGLIAAFIGALVHSQALLSDERDRALAESERARLEATKASQVTGFLVDLFKASNPFEARGEDPTASELLARGVERVDALASQPLVHAELLATLGSVHASLYNMSSADPLLVRAKDVRVQALGPDDPAVAQSALALAMNRWRQGKLDDAETLLREAQRIVDGADPKALVRSTVRRRLGRMMIDRGHHEQAESFLQEALLIEASINDEGSLERAFALRNLGILREDQGRYEDAVGLQTEAVEMAEAYLDADSPSLALTFQASLAGALRRVEDFEQAELINRRALAIGEKAFGPDNVVLSNLLGNLATALHRQGKLEEAQAVNQRALGLRRSAYGDVHAETALSLNNMGNLARVMGRYDEAVTYLQEALEIRQELFGQQHQSLIDTLGNLGDVELALGRPREAARYFESALENALEFLDPSAEVIGELRELVALAKREAAEGE